MDNGAQRMRTLLRRRGASEPRPPAQHPPQARSGRPEAWQQQQSVWILLPPITSHAAAAAAAAVAAAAEPTPSFRSTPWRTGMAAAAATTMTTMVATQAHRPLSVAATDPPQRPHHHPSYADYPPRWPTSWSVAVEPWPLPSAVPYATPQPSVTYLVSGPAPRPAAAGACWPATATTATTTTTATTATAETTAFGGSTATVARPIRPTGTAASARSTPRSRREPVRAPARRARGGQGEVSPWQRNVICR